jgi:hypothetical protein
VSRVAYHEAGHAIAARALGIPIIAVSVSPFGAGGHCQLEPLAGEPSPDDLEDALVITLCGELAEGHSRQW